MFAAKSFARSSLVVHSLFALSLASALCVSAQAQVLSVPSVPNTAPNSAQVFTVPALPTLPQIIINGQRIDPTRGTVESVAEVKEKGKASGVGAIAGGVLGGVIAGQLGNGSGSGSKTTARVLGAMGGGILGHYLERQMRTHTRYAVAVRMEDGTLKSVTGDSALAVGSRVVLENGALRSADAGAGTQPSTLLNNLPNTSAPVMRSKPNVAPSSEQPAAPVLNRMEACRGSLGKQALFVA